MSLSLFLAIAITLCLGQQTSYSDYSMVRFFGINETDVFSFYDASLDVWATNKLEGWADVMIHKDLLSNYLKQYPQNQIVLENVQTEIDRHLEENRLASEAAVGQPYAFTFFPTNTQVNDWLTKTETDYAGTVKRVDLGVSNGGVAIRGLNLGTNPSAPLFFIHCTIHAREWISTTTCCYIIEQLLTVDTNLLQYYNWVIVPVLNVDGYIFSHTTTRLWRKNRQANSGSTCVGTDLNRNFQVGWGGPGADTNPCGETYRGTGAFSGTETQRERDYIDRNWSGNFAVYVDIHAYGGYFMSPWGYTTSLPDSYDLMNELMVPAVAAIRAINGRSYYYGSVANTIYQASGGSNDWSYGEYGVIPSFALECAGTNFTPPTSMIEPVAREVWAGIKYVALNS